jgi:hypothetical protein
VKRAEDTKLVDRCSDTIRMYSLTVYLFNSRRGCWITIKHFTTLLLLSIWDLIARYNIPMPTKESCLKLITSGSSICKVMRMTSISRSNDKFLLFLYFTSAALNRIRSSNFRSALKLVKHYRPFLTGARRHNDGYYLLKLKNMRW